jgi:hypothetical protein
MKYANEALGNNKDHKIRRLKLWNEGMEMIMVGI